MEASFFDTLEPGLQCWGYVDGSTCRGIRIYTYFLITPIIIHQVINLRRMWKHDKAWSLRKAANVSYFFSIAGFCGDIFFNPILTYQPHPGLVAMLTGFGLTAMMFSTIFYLLESFNLAAFLSPNSIALRYNKVFRLFLYSAAILIAIWGAAYVGLGSFGFIQENTMRWMLIGFYVQALSVLWPCYGVVMMIFCKTQAERLKVSSKGHVDVSPVKLWLYAIIPHWVTRFMERKSGKKTRGYATTWENSFVSRIFVQWVNLCMLLMAEEYAFVYFILFTNGLKYVDEYGQVRIQPLGVAIFVMHLCAIYLCLFCYGLVIGYPSIPENSVSRYDFVEDDTVLGIGHYGVVRRGHLKVGNALVPVAAKELIHGMLRREAQNELLHEAKVMTSVSHPNVLRHLGLLLQGECLLLFTELMPGGSLRDHLARNPIFGPSARPDLRVHAALQVAMAMEAVAGAGLVHRDLAARNCLVSLPVPAKCIRSPFLNANALPTVKVSDFGLARQVNTTTKTYEENASVRLPAERLAPECISHRIYSEKSDVFSYGMLLWEIYSQGDIPFRGLPPFNIPKMVVNGYRPLQPEYCEPHVWELMTRCWEQNPENRPSFTEIVAVLTEISPSRPESRAQQWIENTEYTPNMKKYGSFSSQGSQSQSLSTGLIGHNRSDCHLIYVDGYLLDDPASQSQPGTSGRGEYVSPEEIADMNIDESTEMMRHEFEGHIVHVQIYPQNYQKGISLKHWENEFSGKQPAPLASTWLDDVMKDGYVDGGLLLDY